MYSIFEYSYFSNTFFRFCIYYWYRCSCTYLKHMLAYFYKGHAVFRTTGLLLQWTFCISDHWATFTRHSAFWTIGPLLQCTCCSSDYWDAFTMGILCFKLLGHFYNGHSVFRTTGPLLQWTFCISDYMHKRFLPSLHNKHPEHIPQSFPDFRFPLAWRNS
jgi:hypothetical protein